jgi:hypothetical protein
VIDAMANVMTNYAPGNRNIEADVKVAIRALPWFGSLDKAKQGAALSDPVLTALQVGVISPWFTTENGGVHLGDHIYQLSYPSEWVRYRHEARTRMVKPYQFRGPDEWFAVAYDAYYTPDKRGKGAKLNDADPNTKLWFDAYVDTAARSR